MGIFGERRVVLNIKCLKGAMHYCSMGSIRIYASPTQAARSRLLSVAIQPLQNSLNSPQAKSRLNTPEKCAYFFFWPNCIHNLSSLSRMAACCRSAPCLKKGGHFPETSNRESSQAKLCLSRNQTQTYTGKCCNFHVKRSQNLED